MYVPTHAHTRPPGGAKTAKTCRRRIRSPLQSSTDAIDPFRAARRAPVAPRSHYSSARDTHAQTRAVSVAGLASNSEVRVLDLALKSEVRVADLTSESEVGVPDVASTSEVGVLDLASKLEVSVADLASSS